MEALATAAIGGVTARLARELFTLRSNYTKTAAPASARFFGAFFTTVLHTARAFLEFCEQTLVLILTLVEYDRARAVFSFIARQNACAKLFTQFWACQTTTGLIMISVVSRSDLRKRNSMNTRTSSRKFSRPTARGLLGSVAVVFAMALVTTPARAAFHLWSIREIYTDSSGSLQFIEFFTSSSSQQFVGGQQVQVQNVGATITHTFTIPSNLPGDTANNAFLLGTSGADAAGAPTPDYIIPSNFLFAGGGGINFFGANGGSYSALPTDGVQSRTWGDGNAVNTPQNFAGQIGMVPEPATWALFGTGGIGLCFLLRRRST